MYLTANPKFRLLYAVWAFLECLGFGGLIQGWSSLVYVLKDEGLYSDLCSYNETSSVNNSTESTEDTKCDDQDSKLNLVFTIASLSSTLGSLVVGQINFLYGTRISRLFATATFIPGSLLIAFASKEIPWLIFPGTALIGFGGIAFLMTSTQVSILFPVGGAFIVGVLCGGYDASAGIQLLVKIGHENGITRKTSYFIIAGCHVLTFVNTFIFLPKDFIHKPTPEIKATEINVSEEDKGKKKEVLKEDNEKTDKSSQKEGENTGKQKGVLSYLTSPTYIFHIVWLSFLQLRFLFVLGSINKSLESLVDTKDEVSHYTNVLLYTMMGGIIGSPFAGFVYSWQHKVFENSKSEARRNKMPAVIPLAVTTTLCLVMSGLIMAEDPELLYAVFALLLMFRSFLYTVGAGYVSAICPSSYFGIMYGVMIIISGIFSLLQYALFEWYASESFMQVNIFLVVLTAVTYINPAYQWVVCRREEKKASKEEPDTYNRKVPQLDLKEDKGEFNEAYKFEDMNTDIVHKF